jgi:hypothetical protein
MLDRSPFPGMDPWLESDWSGVHHVLINDLADQLAAALPGDLYVEVEEDLYVVGDLAPRSTTFRPDVAVFYGRDGTRPSLATDVNVAVVEPIHIVLSAEPVTQGHIEIRTLAADHPLVTAIEVFSPTNKRDRRARVEYRRKRQRYYDAGATVVEIDLLRGGRPLIGVPLEYIPEGDRQAYACGVRCGGLSGDIELDYYPLPLRQRLPAIRVPLRPRDAAVTIDLQPPVDRAYARGRYGTRLDYTRPPSPRLSAEDAAWAAERIAAATAGTSDL